MENNNKPLGMSGGMPAGLNAIRHYIAMRDAKPFRQMDDVIHSVHIGTEWEAELRLSDLRLAATPTPPIEGRDADVERVIHSAIVEWCDGGPIHPHRLAGLSRRIAAALQALGERL